MKVMQLKEHAIDYKNSVFLPKTNFSMKANLPIMEPALLANWQESKLYDKIRKTSKGREKFILHFGPPYANGNIHIGHALTEVLKDIVNKTYQMQGFDAPMVPGWDCHGLPIEWKVEEQYKAKGLNKDSVNFIEFRKECRAFANHWIPIQKAEFERLGIIADFDNYYSTMDFATEAQIVNELGSFLMDGSLYRGLKPVMWSVVEKTALAEAEVEYKDHTSDSIMVAFPVVATKLQSLKDAHAVIWTTTPWTLPGNRALSYGEEIDYVVVEVNTGTDLIPVGKKFLLAKDLLQSFCEACGLGDIKTLVTLKGTELAGTICAHPWRGKGYDFDVPLLPGSHVTVDVGTGLVHTAPGHGLEDFEVGKAFSLEIPETIQGDGTYYDHVPIFNGKHIYKANPLVIAELTAVGALLHATKITHSYPHSWRSKAPLIYRATAQWFISMEKTALRKKALDAIENVEWYPSSGKNRIKSMVESRPDWCLSRQRAWGTPITVFVNKRTGEPLRDPKVHQRIVDAIAKEGADAWFQNDASYFLANDYNADDFEKVNDILDVWFDSGCSHAFVLRDRHNQKWPADVYLEGSDQHRGWFQSSLLQSCGTKGVAPYKKVVTHGFVLDERGYKMSKSLGNTVTPKEIIDKYGADLLRLWIVNSDYTEDLRIGSEILKRQEDIYRRFRNTLRYLLGALDNFSEEEALPFSEMPPLELFILHQLKQIEKSHKIAVESFDFSSFYMALHHFCAVDLSAFYFDIRKDSLYCDPKNHIKRRATRTVMKEIFLCLTHWLAPVLSFTAEEAFSNFQLQTGVLDPTSIHLSQFPNLPESWFNSNIFERFQEIRNIRRVITTALEIERSAKTIGSSLQGDVALYITSEKANCLSIIDLAELSITSDAEIVLAMPPAGAVTLDDVSDVGVIVNIAKGQKCQRCWRVLPEVGDESLNRSYHQICIRCEEAVHLHA